MAEGQDVSEAIEAQQVQEAWQMIVDATGVDKLMRALQLIGLKSGALAPPMPAPAEPAEPDEVRETNGKGMPARAAAVVRKEGK